MKNKKIITSIIIVAVLAVLSLITYQVLTHEDKNTTLNLLEKQWIEKNKNQIIDLGIVNDIPIFNYNGEGIIFDFISDLEKDTGLEFNKLSYKITDNISTSYAFKMVDKAGDKDILVYTDNYAIITNSKIKYNNLSELQNLVIGVLDSDLEKLNIYLNGTNVTFKTYQKTSDMITDIKKTGDDKVIDAIALPKVTYLNSIITNSLNVSYNITEMTKDYVITLGDNDRLNDILKKYYKKWSKNNFNDKYNTYLADDYFTFNNIDEKEIAKFRSKRYVYGFINNKPYDYLIDNKLYGVNSNLMKEFSKIANVEISYNDYNSFSSLLEDFNANKIDFIFDNNTNNSYPMDVYNTVSTYDEKAVVISSVKNNITINSISSLLDKEVITIKDTEISNYLTNKNIKNKQYNNMNQLLDNLSNNSIAIVDKDTYNYYNLSDSKKYKIDLEFNLDNDYNFVIRDIKDNTIFSKFFNFYLSFVNEKSAKNTAYLELLNKEDKDDSIHNILYVGFSILVVGAIGLFTLTKNTKKKKPKKITKGSKLRYIDQLTSLKNRNYLNDNIESWDSSEVYPQTIIIVDLNNIAYINDNYGHSEGDKVIREAANILIRNQIENSEIIRTNGNEFLIYLVGYDEKQVISYTRKLSKDFKEITHGFGAAFGYSIITDAIKTVDDAVNEATLAMRENKEGFNN